MPTLSQAANAKPADEKITVNIGVVDLGQIDLLISEGFYSNRTDLIRTAIRRELALHAGTVDRLVTERLLVLGSQHIDSAQLQRLKREGKTLEIRALGLLTIARDVTPALARKTIASISVLGAFHASREVREALADRMC